MGDVFKYLEKKELSIKDLISSKKKKRNLGAKLVEQVGHHQLTNNICLFYVSVSHFSNSHNI